MDELNPYDHAEQGASMDKLLSQPHRRGPPVWAWFVLVIAVIVAIVAVRNAPFAREPSRPEHGGAAKAENLETLVEQYKRFELPLLPADAVVCIQDEPEAVYLVNGKRMHYQNLVFALDKPAAEKPVKCLVGTHEWTSSHRDRLTPVSPDDPNAKEAEVADFSHGFEYNVGLAMALQCKAHSWDGLANHLFARSKSDYHGPVSVADVAWQYWRYQFTKATTNRPQILQRLKKLLNEKALATTENRELVADMELTLVPKPVTDPIERLIESLVDYSGGKEPVEALTLAGFAAVPQLIRHLDDRRLTREIHPRIMNCPPLHGRFSEHVTRILEGLVLNDRHTDLTKETASAWWKNAQKIGEEKYLRSKVLPEDNNAEWPCGGMLSIIAAKYPEYLPELYRVALRDYPKMQSHPFVTALVDSTLPRQGKIQALLHGAEHRTLENRRAALFGLLKLKYEGFVGLLVRTLDSLPATRDGPYWGNVGAFAILVARSRSPDAWDALVRTAKRVDMGTRMEFMNVMNYGCGTVEDTPLAPRIAFLRGFLNDSMVRDVATNRDKYVGPCAGFTFDRIVVGDFAALQLASLLDVKADADPSWTVANWKRLRSRVDAKLLEYDAANKGVDRNEK